MGLNQNVLASHYVSNNKLCTRLLYSNIIIRSNNLNITNMSKFFLFSTFSKQKYCVCGCAGCVCDDVYISSLSVFIRVLSCHTGHSSHAYNILSCPKNTVLATMTFSGLKPSVSPSNVAQNANPGTVLETARPDDSKTPPTC